MEDKYRQLIISLLCNGDNQPEGNNGCGNKNCQYRDVDGACDIVGMCNDAAKAISDLLSRNKAAEKCIQEIQDARDKTRPSYVVDQILSEYWNEV